MGWEVHITRAADRTQSEQRPITADEWLAVVAADPELRVDGANGPYFVTWSGPCSHPDGGWFDWCDGRVFTKNPDRAVLGKMLGLAVKLDAAVQGDDGEAYIHPSQLDPDRPAARSALTRQRVIAGTGAAALVLLAVWLVAKAAGFL